MDSSADISFRRGISCVIVSYKSLEPLKECLESLDAQEGIDFEIIVVDNDSRDGTSDLIKSLGIKYILPDRNLGFGAAVNLGAKKANHKYLLIMNPDIFLPRNSLRKMYKAAETEPEFGIIAPALEYPDGRSQLSARSLPGRWDFLTGRGSPLFRLGITGEKRAGYIVPEGKNPLKIPAVSATAILIPAQLFLEIGGFDERFFMYLEDIDLCRRITEKGLPIFLHPGIKIKHSWRKSSSKRPLFSTYQHHLSVLKYFLKYDKNRFIMNLLLAIALTTGFIYTAFAISIKRILGR